MTSSDWNTLSEISCFPDSEINYKLSVVCQLYLFMEKLVVFPLAD